MIYGLLLILFIIYMPRGILGTFLEWRQRKRVQTTAVMAAT
jgi:ABC-type branched-subunit amino acid transport system permease subunit